MLLDHLRIASDALNPSDKLVALHSEHTVCKIGHIRLITIKMAYCKSCYLFNARGQDVPKLAL